MSGFSWQDNGAICRYNGVEKAITAQGEILGEVFPLKGR